MPAFDTSKMSADEFKFIRAYCSAVRRDFDKIETALTLASRDELAITCPFTAAKLALELHELQLEFADKLATMGAKFLDKDKDKVLLSSVPSLDEIGRIFAMSFFKLVDSETKAVLSLTQTGRTHDGWSSGRPTDWQHSLKSLYDIQKQENESSSSSGMFFGKLFKFFTSMHTPQSLPDPYEEEYYDEDDEEDDYYDQFFS